MEKGKKVEEDIDSDASDESYYSGLEEEDETSEDEADRSGEVTDDENDNDSYQSEDNENDIDLLKSIEDNDSSPESIESEEDAPISTSFGDSTDKIANDEAQIEDTLKRKKPLGGGPTANSTNDFDEADTSDEEEIRNTVGNIPMEWYRDYSHIGYDIRGQKIARPVQGDALENFLATQDDPDFWRTVRDHTNEENIRLTDEDLEIMQNIQSSRFPEKGFDPYEPYVDWFTGEKMIHPIKDNPEAKSSFIPSKWEHKRIIKIVRAIRNGWIKPKSVKTESNKFYLMWRNDDTARKDHPMHWPAPKMKLPGHDESYNPPPEYLMTEEELKQWEDTDPLDRQRNFVPKKYDCLRKVPAYSNFIEERFERCLDLYLCPRQRRVRLQVDPEDLIPKLPKPRDLQPFPSSVALVYHGHTAPVNGITIDPTGQWLASGSADNTVRLWEVATCRCLKTIKFEDGIKFIEWSPSASFSLIAVAVGKSLFILNPHLGDKLVSQNTENILSGSENTSEDNEKVTWAVPPLQRRNQGVRIQISHEKVIEQGAWHKKGDYFALVLADGGSQSVVIHQITKRKSQMPFKKPGGLVQCVQFHPIKPFLYVATQSFIRIYHLQKQELIKKLASGVKWISSMDVHPQGDNLIIGSYDKRLCWFDIDLSAKPYKTLRHHKKAVRQVKYHQRYPLFASASDDGSVIICHGKVFSDYMQNPLIVPVKVIRCHTPNGDIGVTDCVFHPSQPWIFTAGADNTIKLCT
ncbi:ribosome biogenesis protein bop1-like [Rhopilema esculentum]|uniref:ribosome biogenesis protein bop1-like n=1 Tax=Rhopilema esculentum TaxID=499914 RepID=UPI0031D137F1|eukprot:gene2327-17962_t